jgi:acyl-CoA dehydrogenase
VSAVGIAVAIGACSQPSRAQSAIDEWPTEVETPLDKSAVEEPPEQCSRDDAKPGDSYFIPSLSQIDEFESALELGLTKDLFGQWRARSPHYDESHETVCDTVRRFVEREISPHVDAWEAAGELPPELHRKAAEAGIFGLGYPEEYGGTGREHFDVFHSLIQSEELCRPGAGGIPASLMTHGIGLPPILALGSETTKRQIAPDVLSGDKIIALGITEPSGGSDAANLRTKATRKGAAFIVNGEKTYITSGMRADYVTLAVRTGDAGMGGISLLLVETDRSGVQPHAARQNGLACLRHCDAAF